MTKVKQKIGWTIAVLTGAFLLLQNAFFISDSCAKDLLIIANKDVPVDELKRADLESIFLGQKVKWGDGSKITFVLLRTESHETFLRENLRSTPAQYRQYWKKMIFTGKARAPKAFRSPEKLVEYIAGTSGTIGYIPSETYNDNVKIISVQ
ncbi:hypothetical protein DENIS_2976 [Desulfonema ishimotonii]|uniref:PBP domain-containing protein n=1 Tax=Desulfonema ishimotonii TaxID=45657 RepID=A0A401FYI7_9BACT|nr:hypothetical protein [Desulfonema ishimotonii]GBC62013.1 hypothetical protein DENIS_2976 [Desulfonema ishimotonii]